MDEAPYLLPRGASEIDRLDVQHYALVAAAGTNRLAPIVAPSRILDVGSGSGQWAFEMCAEFPDAEVTGLDLVPSRPHPPANYRFVEANVLDGLPFDEGAFDYAHQRLMVAGIPVDSWSGAIAELVRVTRSGGWVELAETSLVRFLQGGGPAIDRIQDLAATMAAERGLDVTDVVFRSLDGWLRAAGLWGVNRRVVEMGVGDWAGEIGRLQASNVRAGIAHLLEHMPDVSQQEQAQLVTGLQAEFEQFHVVGRAAFAYGQKR
jgi:ubiquinone/menaquinone biosynthesis C-methylase UbiE